MWRALNNEQIIRTYRIHGFSNFNLALSLLTRSRDKLRALANKIIRELPKKNINQLFLVSLKTNLINNKFHFHLESLAWKFLFSGNYQLVRNFFHVLTLKLFLGLTGKFESTGATVLLTNQFRMQHRQEVFRISGSII